MGTKNDRVKGDEDSHPTKLVRTVSFTKDFSFFPLLYIIRRQFSVDYRRSQGVSVIDSLKSGMVETGGSVRGLGWTGRRNIVSIYVLLSIHSECIDTKK